MTPDPEIQPQFYESVTTKRLIAWVIDTVLIVLVCLVIVPFTAFVGLFFFPLLLLIVGFLYRWATLATASATLGMRLMSMELREADDRRLSGTVALLHTLGYTISIGSALIQIISMVLMLNSKRGQGLTDMVLGTVALNTRY